MQRVGVIGLGKMGLPIARNLMEGGFEVIGYRRSGSAELIEAGGQAGGFAGRRRRAAPTCCCRSCPTPPPSPTSFAATPGR